MFRLATVVTAMALVCACSRDRAQERGAAEPAADEQTETSSQTGVGVVSAHELGPQATRRIPVTSRSAQAVAAFERGREMQENMREADAAEKFREAIRLDPEFALAHAYLGFVSRRDREQMFARAEALATELPAAEKLVIDSLQARAQGDRKQLTKLAEQLVTLTPRDWRAQMWAADAANRRGDYEQAISAYQRAIALAPKVAEPYNNLAYVFAYRGEYDKALDAARSYARLKPNEPNPHDSLGEILLMAGKFEQAEAAFARAVEVMPDFAHGWDGMALSRAYRRDWDGAIEALQKYREVMGASGRLEGARRIALVHAAAGKHGRALAVLDQLARGGAIDDAYAAHVAITRGVVHYAAGEHAAARRALQRVGDAADDKARSEAAMWRVLVELAANDVEAAKRAIEALERDGADSQRRLARGALALREGKPKDAVEQLEGIDMDFAYAGLARGLLADALSRSGDRDAARKVRADLAAWYKRDLGHLLQRELVPRSRG